MKYCEVCSSLIIDDICTNRRCPSKNAKLASWVIDGALVRFKEPVTKARATEAVKHGESLIIKPPSGTNEDKNKVWVNSPTW